MYQAQPLPSVYELDALIIMGGPMAVHDDKEYPWLTPEKEFIASAIRREIPVFGVCLGAQLIADVLGAKITKNVYEEIGWFPVEQTEKLLDGRLESLPASFYALHWHSDTFAVPSGATNFIASKGCAHQAFVYGENVLGLQFHLEMLPSHVQSIYQACGKPEQSGPYIQSLDEMLMPADNFQRAAKILEEFVKAFIFQNSDP